MAGNGTWTEDIPGAYVDVELMGDSRQVDNMLRGLYEAFDDHNIGYDFLQDYVDPLLRKRTEDRFASEGDDVSGPWLPLAPATVARRGSAHPINVRTGVMRGFLLHDPPDIATHSLGATMWSPGRNAPKAIRDKIQTAQSGGMTPQGSAVPPRPVLGVNEQDLQLVMESLGRYLDKHVSAGGAEVNIFS